jgi:hypothetical protein
MATPARPAGGPLDEAWFFAATYVSYEQSECRNGKCPSGTEFWEFWRASELRRSLTYERLFLN